MFETKDIDILEFFGLGHDETKTDDMVHNFLITFMDKVYEALDTLRYFKKNLDTVHYNYRIDKNEIYEICYESGDSSFVEYIVGNFSVDNYGVKDIEFIFNEMYATTYFNCADVNFHNRIELVTMFNRVDLESDNAIKKYEDLYIYLHELSMPEMSDG